ncbi:hypothetical protein Q1695_011075 [Nippostrongylus brasiliensis]|nr:hypothetical protein Q1695_011075 [Nippostrongylus brasiliensis]
MILLQILQWSLLISAASARCSICSLFADYYDDIGPSRSERPFRDAAENSSEFQQLQPRIRSPGRTEQEVISSLGRASDLASSLFGNLMGLISERTGRTSSSDIPDTLRGRLRQSQGIIGPKTSSESAPRVTEQIFSIFDTIGSGFMHMSRLDGPHICTRESSKKYSSDGSTSLKSEKSCKRFPNARKCIDSRTDSKGTTETTRIEECCEGYETKDIFRYGCPIESTVQSMEEVLEQLNSSLWTLAKDANLSKKLDSDDITVIVSPANEENVVDPKTYVLSRIVPSIYHNYDWQDNDVLGTSAGGEYMVSQSDDAFGSVRSYLNCLPLNSSSVRARNGIVYVVEGDLKPAADTLLSALIGDPRFATFTSLLSEDLRGKLSSNHSFTVFAPSEKALSALSESLLKDIKQGTGCASDFTRSHIVDGSFCSHNLFDRRLKSLAGSDVETRSQIKSGERIVRVGRARVILSDIFARNGVIHMIDDVVFNDELLSWREHLNVYNSKLKEALEDVVGNSSEALTILVPPAENGTISTEVAENHLVMGEALEDFRRPSTITTRANSTFFTGYSRKTSPIWMRISVEPRQRQRGQIGCSRITQDSVRGCKAVLHFIDKPLPLVKDNFDSFLAKRPDLSKFYRLWRDSSVNDTLTEEKPRTVFIPSDDAFSNNEYKKLLTNPKLADIFVKRYLIDEPLCPFDLRHNPSEIRIQTYANLNGEGLRPTQTDDDIFMDGARVQESEIVLNNGVAYVLESTIARQFVSTQPGENRRKSTNLLTIIP